MTLDEIKSIPAKKREIDALFDRLSGMSILSTVNLSPDPWDKNLSWTTVYKYEPEEGFKVSHDAHHYYMSEEDMWTILENAIEVKV